MVSITNASSQPTIIDLSDPRPDPIEYIQEDQNSKSELHPTNSKGRPITVAEVVHEIYESYRDWKYLNDIEIKLKSANRFSDLCPIFEKAEVHLSYFGRRYITVQGYEDTLSLDHLARRIKKMIVENSCFKRTDNVCVKSLIKTLNCLYEKSDQQVELCNCLTRHLSLLRNDRIIFTNNY